MVCLAFENIGKAEYNISNTVTVATKVIDARWQEPPVGQYWADYGFSRLA
jgi:hypothetical protein